MSYLKFSSVPNIFATFSTQCIADPTLKISTQPNLGLITRAYETGGDDDVISEEATQWPRFVRYVKHLNDTAPEGTTYKVLYLTRHGLGVHNVVHKRVGNEAWDNHWSRLEGDGDEVWADAVLVPEGVAQAQALNKFWTDLIALGAPLPQTLYTSPLTRCLQTTTHIFKPLYSSPSPPNTNTNQPTAPPFRPIVKELLREQLTDHTCDRRSPHSVLRARFPDFAFEDGFAETDQLWRADRWETMPEHAARKYRVLHEIFRSDEGAFLSLTVHSFAIAVILTVCGADVYRVREGSSIAILVKAEEVEEGPEFAGLVRPAGY